MRRRRKKSPEKTVLRSTIEKSQRRDFLYDSRTLPQKTRFHSLRRGGLNASSKEEKKYFFPRKRKQAGRENDLKPVRPSYRDFTSHTWSILDPLSPFCPYKSISVSQRLTERIPSPFPLHTKLLSLRRERLSQMSNAIRHRLEFSSRKRKRRFKYSILCAVTWPYAKTVPSSYSSDIWICVVLAVTTDKVNRFMHDRLFQSL